MNKDERRIFIQRLDRLLKKMKGLFADTYIRAIEELKDAIRSGVKFEWKDYVTQTAQIEKMLDILAGKTELIIADGLNHSYQSGINAAVNRINQRYEEINAKYKKRRELNQIQKQATQTIRADVAKSNEGKNLKLSSRVWSLQDQAKDEIQILVNNAIAEGKGVKDMRNYVLKYLNNPKLFTMYVRNKETGELELSETARKLHPGRGVYRDPLKNAERLLRTEMLAAYRRAEIEAYQRNPLVIGYEIKTSGNHTTMKMGKPVPLKDICDKLQGRYPKTFMWTGWHPNCRCILLPITVPDGQLKDFFKAQDEGRAEEWSAQHGVQFPPQMKTWFEDNGKRIYAVNADPHKALPPWIEDNKQELFIDYNVSSENDNTAAISFIKKTIQDNIDNHLNLVKRFDTDLIREEWRNDYKNAIVGVDSDNQVEKHKNIEYAYNIIQYTTSPFIIDTEKVSTKMPYDIYKKAKEYGIVKDLKSFFDNQVGYYPLLNIQGVGTYYDNNYKSIIIDLDSKRWDYDDGLKKIIYHEYGHADYFARDLRNNKDILTAFEKIKKQYANFDVKAFRSSISQYKKNCKIINNTLADELLGSYLDIVQAVEPKHQYLGKGHSAAGYFNSFNIQLSEFAAHLSEFNYLGNGVIKDLDPEMWNIMKTLSKKIYK